MYDVEDIKSCVQEWFSDASDPVEVAFTYHEIVAEAKRQLEYMMEIRCEQ